MAQLTPLFQDQLICFAFLLPNFKKVSKQEFSDKVKATYDISNPKTGAFYTALQESNFNSLLRVQDSVTIE